MNTQRLLASTFLVLLSACSAECSCGGTGDDDDTSSSSQGGGDSATTGQGGAPGTGGSGEGGQGGAGGAPGTGGAGGGDAISTGLRFAHLAPTDSSYDVCVFNADEEDPLPLFGGEGIAFKDISEHGAFEAGAYKLVVTAAGAASCGTPIATGELELAEGEAKTVAIIGRPEADAGDPDALGFAVYTDDLTPPADGNVRARFIHAAPGAPSVDIGTIDEDGAFVPLWEGATYPEDAGYLADELEAFAELDLVAILAGTGDEPTPLLTVTIEGPANTIVEGFALGLPGGAAGAEVVTVTTAFGE